jgi:hypothetical protein
MYWKEFPSQVKAQDDTGNAKVMLPDRFSESIDAAAMAEGSTGSDAYMEGWHWDSAQEREGSAKEVVDAVAAELDQAFPKKKLIEMIQQHKQR